MTQKASDASRYAARSAGGETAPVTDGKMLMPSSMTAYIKIGLGLFIIGLPLIVASAMILLLAVAAWAPALAVSVVVIGVATIALGAVWLFQNPHILR
jgi:hypothetical protein